MQSSRGTFGIHFDTQRDAVVHGDCQRLGASHTAESGGHRECARQGTAETLAGDGGEALVGPLQDALCADVDPGPGCHLPVHGQPEVFEAPELVPVAPFRHQVRVCDEDPGRPLVRAQYPDWLSGLDQHRLVVAERGEGLDHGVVGVP